MTTLLNAENTEMAKLSSLARALIDTPILEAAAEIEALAVDLIVETRFPDNSIDIGAALDRILNLSVAIKQQARDVTPPTEEQK
jgi:hypothetical protein